MYILQRLLRSFILVLLLFPLSGSCANGPHQGGHTDSTAFIEKEMRRMMRKHHLPAMALSIVEEEEILFQEARGFIDLENKIPATAQSLFKLYSVSKAFTALEIFREIEEGMVDLETPISEYLPEFSIQSRFGDLTPITVKDVLAHRSGLPRNGCITCLPGENDPYTLEKFDRSAEDCYMAYPAGFRYHYSNLGYNLLGRIVEENRCTGFASFMNTHLLQDLGMESSTFHLGEINNEHAVALGYEYYKRKQYPMLQPDINNVPSGNLYSTLEDLSAFLKALLNNEVFSNENTMELMYCDHYSTPKDPETMGLGWKTTRITGDELMIWHDGGPDEGIGALVAFIPGQKLGIAMVANSTRFSSDKTVPFAMDILTRLMEKKLNRVLAKAEKHPGMNLPEEVLKEYEGNYIAWGMPMAVENRKAKLKGKIGGLSLDLIPTSETEFRVSHWMDRMGLTKIIRPPVEFGKISITFTKTGSQPPESMIIDLNHISHEICPRYPELTSLNTPWNHLPGNYQLARRLPGNRAGELRGDMYSIFVEDDVLKASGVFGPIIPLDDHSILIVSGPFAGETMEYFPESGHIVHQNSVFIPKP